MEEESCNTRLALGLGGGVDIFAAANGRRGRQRKPPVQFHVLFPPCAKEEAEEEEEEDEGRGWLAGEEQGVNRWRSRSRSRTREEGRDVVDRLAEEGRSGGGGARKKLRLTQEQSALLDCTFRERSTLTSMQKQELADKLNLRPRQVEVWFQNRRARTKLKQTEVDCEFLKKCCESLSDENVRLKKELQELRSIKSGSPFCMQLPKAATLTMCPSCERILAGDGRGSGCEDIRAAKSEYYNWTVKDTSMAC